MPLFVCGNSSKYPENKNDTCLFVQKPCLKANYIESYVEEGIEIKYQFRN